MNLGRYIMIGGLIAAIVLTIVFTTNNHKSAEAVENEVLSEVELTGLEKKGDSELKEFYGLSRDDVVGYALYAPSSSTEPEEWFLVKASDREQLESIRRAAEMRLKVQKESLKKSGKELLEKLDKALICERGEFLMVAIGAQAPELEKAFQKSVRH